MLFWIIKGLLCQRNAVVAVQLTRSRILLKADEGEFGPAYADKEIKEAVEVSIPTIERTRKTFALEGLTAAVTPKKRSKPSRPQKFDGEKEAHLIALACSEAPEGHARWTLRLLAEKMVELNPSRGGALQCDCIVLSSVETTFAPR